MPLLQPILPLNEWSSQWQLVNVPSKYQGIEKYLHSYSYAHISSKLATCSYLELHSSRLN